MTPRSAPGFSLTLNRVGRAFRAGFWLRPAAALRDISLRLESGEAAGLVGHNGAGKSTLLKLIAGADRPTSGHLAFTPDRPRMGFAPETPAFPPHQTVRGLLRLLCRLAPAVPHAAPAAQRIDRELERFDLARLAHKPVRVLSKGQRQRLNLAQALLDDPELLLLDEPLSGLDPRWRERVREILLDASARGVTLLFSSHILEDVQLLCRRVLLLDKGSLRYDGPLRIGTDERPADGVLSGYALIVDRLPPGLAALLDAAAVAVRRGPDALTLTWPSALPLDPLFAAAQAGETRILHLSARMDTEAL